jgi:hypothetical protein
MDPSDSPSTLRVDRVDNFDIKFLWPQICSLNGPLLIMFENRLLCLLPKNMDRQKHCAKVVQYMPAVQGVFEALTPIGVSCLEIERLGAAILHQRAVHARCMHLCEQVVILQQSRGLMPDADQH